jgi:glutamate dehydrogenase (NAD(P)+)
MKEKLNPFKIAQLQFDATAERLGLDEATRELLRRPMLEMHATLPVKMDDGPARLQAFRVHNTARGLAKGGIRWHPDETIDTVRAPAA